jgi:hypothetical protein
MTSSEECLEVSVNVLALLKRKFLFKSHGLKDFLTSCRAIGGSALQCWDNSTRGLDSATALEFVRTLRTSTKLTGATALVSVYQASQSIYDVCHFSHRVSRSLIYVGI